MFKAPSTAMKTLWYKNTVSPPEIGKTVHIDYHQNVVPFSCPSILNIADNHPNFRWTRFIHRAVLFSIVSSYCENVGQVSLPPLVCVCSVRAGPGTRRLAGVITNRWSAASTRPPAQPSPAQPSPAQPRYHSALRSGRCMLPPSYTSNTPGYNVTYISDNFSSESARPRTWAQYSLKVA